MRIGSLCTGYGGLDMAVNGDLAWVSDIDRAARTLLAHRFPNTPNLGDLTATDWHTVEPVNMLTAGYPCQPFSHAGNREGTDDARHIWPYIADAIRLLRPRYVFLENVAGHLSLGFGDVLGDLAEAGYDAQWTSLRASDVGAPHRRERVFILATDTERRGRRKNDSHGRDMVRENRIQGRWNESPSPSRPDPQAPADAPGVGRAERWPESTPRQRGHGATVSGAPLSANADGRRFAQQPESDGDSSEHVKPSHGNNTERPDTRWGAYAPAVAQWEHVTERTAPDATAPNRDGKPRLSPRFVEWMMGLPAGWVTDVPGISRTGQLHLLGNGVVPQQAATALHHLTTPA